MLTALEVGGSAYKQRVILVHMVYDVSLIDTRISFHFNGMCINTHVPTHTYKHTQRERERCPTARVLLDAYGGVECQLFVLLCALARACGR